MNIVNDPMGASATREAKRRIRLVLTGTVQGIGLRPWLVRASTSLGLCGSVENHGADVHVEWEGASASVAAALETLRHHGPPGLRIATWDQAECPPTGTTRFEVGESAVGPGGWSLPPDLGPCADCLRELQDPSDRRFRYPFVSCTRCGPRWTVALRTPWCRDNTTFAGFPLCAQCHAEFTDPSDRRFHAETTACPACGPTLRWRSSGNSEPTATGTRALEAAASLLRDGGIVAVLGVGGFQLMVDATSEAAVARLRERKHRPTKPLAVLFPDVETTAQCAQVSPRECQVLEDVSRPIVLLDAKLDGMLAPNVAGGLGTIGAMLPMTPLHGLLMDDVGVPLVCTSGNVSGEPLEWNVGDGLRRLGRIADGFLVHDRPIAAPADDPVVRVIDGNLTVLRHGRGTAPFTIALPKPIRPSRAWGGHLKTAPAVGAANAAVLGPHSGDLETLRATEHHRRQTARLAEEMPDPPVIELHDRHPDTAGSLLAQKSGLQTIGVPHHQAHAAALAAEHVLRGPMLAAVWDGAGLGDDNTVWGGEFLVRYGCDAPWRRFAHLPGFALIGGDAATRDPRRCAFALLWSTLGADTANAWAVRPEAEVSKTEREAWGRLLTSGIACPWATSAGRWFDAVAGLLGVSTVNEWEGEAAARLETAATQAGSRFELPRFGVERTEFGATIDGNALLGGLLDGVCRGIAPEMLARGFHQALARLIVDMARVSGMPDIGLTGGCFVNKLLVEDTADRLRADGFRVWSHRQLPPGDGNLAFGQLAWLSEHGEPATRFAGGHPGQSGRSPLG